MNNEGVDQSKRQFLTTALTVVGAVGTGYLAVPFLSQMQPSVKTMAAGAPVDVDLSKMETGQLDEAPIWTDCKTFPTEPFKGGRVDLFIASYPCQPFSAAGKRKGPEDERHLWPYCREFIKETKPKVCFFENVEGHVSLGLREVLTDLVGLGYRVESDSGEPAWGLFSAAEVGAPHQRKRVFILAYRDLSWVALCRNNGGVGRQSEQNEELGNTPGNNQRRTSITAMHREWIAAGGPSCNVADPGSTEFNRVSESTERREDQAPGVSGAIVANFCQQGPQNTELKTIQSAWRRNERRTTAKFCCSLWPSRPGEPQYEWEEPRVFDGKLNPDWVESLQGVPPGWTQLSNALPGENRIDRLRLLGNGVVPATAEKAFITLLNRIKKTGINREKVETQMELF